MPSAAAVPPLTPRVRSMLSALAGRSASNTLHHALLFEGANMLALEAAAATLAAGLLGMGADAAAGPDLFGEAPVPQASEALPLETVIAHPDCFALRPGGKMRQINADTTREWMRDLYKTAASAQGSGNRVAIVFEPERMHTAAANAFLKTLEEPPAGVYIFLLSVQASRLMDTTRSRCLRVPLRGAPAALENEQWQQWLADYKAWLAQLFSGPVGKANLVPTMLRLYALCARFAELTPAMAKAALKESPPPEHITPEEKDALEAGTRRGLRTQLLAQLQSATHSVGLAAEAHPLKLKGLMAALQEAAGLMELNAAEGAALETFMLQALRTAQA